MTVSSTSRGNGLWKPLLLLILVLSGLVLAWTFHLGDRVKDLQDWIRSFGAWGPLVYGILFILATIAAIPGSAGTFMAGGLFGTAEGLLVISLASTLGAALSFLISRYFARDAVEKWLGKNEKFRQLADLTQRRGALIVAIVRLIPGIPFNLVNYGFGLTRVGFWPYLLWSWICMLPGTLLFVTAGDAAAKGLSERRIPWDLLALFVGILLLLVAATPALKKRIKY